MSPVSESVVGSEPHGSKVYGSNLPGVSGPQRLFCKSQVVKIKRFMVRQEEDTKCLGSLAEINFESPGTILSREVDCSLSAECGTEKHP